MREVKFRGKAKNGGEWFYGSLAFFPDSQTAHIIPCCSCKNDGDVVCNFVEVDPETIGQCTGLHDIHCHEIYEGDVVFWIAKDHKGFGHGRQGEMFWDKFTMAWCIKEDRLTVDGRPLIVSRPFDLMHREIVGNIHDNPEMMERAIV